MRLHEVPRDTWVTVTDEDWLEGIMPNVLLLRKVDGSFAHCETKVGTHVYVNVSTEVEPIIEESLSDA